MSQPALTHYVVHHFSVSVPNLDEAITWYAKVFGFTLEKSFAVDAIPAKAAFLRSQAIRLELWQTERCEPLPEMRRHPNSDLKSCGTKHIAFTVPDLCASLTTLAGQGVDIAAVQRSPTEPMRYEPNPAALEKSTAFAAFLRDPAGTLIELIDQKQLDAMG